MKLEEYIENFFGIFYPDRCPVCDDVMPEVPEGKPLICSKCKGKVKYVISPRCLKCGKQIYTMEEEFCTDCKEKPHLYTQGIGVFAYDEKIKQSMYRFKYSNRRSYAAFYAQAIWRNYSHIINRWQIDVIIPVPLHKSKLRKRGYNQAELIATSLSKISKIPVDKEILARTKNTKAMKELNDKERINNLINAFKITADEVKYKRALLIDDIYTTGATIDRCAESLIDGGACKVYFAAVCIGNGF